MSRTPYLARLAETSNRPSPRTIEQNTHHLFQEVLNSAKTLDLELQADKEYLDSWLFIPSFFYRFKTNRTIFRKAQEVKAKLLEAAEYTLENESLFCENEDRQTVPQLALLYLRDCLIDSTSSATTVKTAFEICTVFTKFCENHPSLPFFEDILKNLTFEIALRVSQRPSLNNNVAIRGYINDFNSHTSKLKIDLEKSIAKYRELEDLVPGLERAVLSKRDESSSSSLSSLEPTDRHGLQKNYSHHDSPVEFLTHVFTSPQSQLRKNSSSSALQAVSPNSTIEVRGDPSAPRSRLGSARSAFTTPPSQQK